MTSVVEQIKSQARLLSQEERAELAQYLLESLEPEEDGVREAWRAEIRRRAEEVRSGVAHGIPAEEVMAEMRKRIA